MKSIFKRVAKVTLWTIITFSFLWGIFCSLVLLNSKFHFIELKSGYTSAFKSNLINRKSTINSVIYTSTHWTKILSPQKAYSIAWSQKAVQEVFASSIASGSKPDSDISLVYQPTDSSLYWQIDFVDRVCECEGDAKNDFNLVRVVLNPLDAQVINLEIRKKISKTDLINFYINNAF